MKFNSIRFKASLLFTFILALILAGFSVFLFRSVRNLLYQNIKAELAVRAEQISGTINAYGEMTGGQLPAMSLMREFLSDSGEAPRWKGAIDKLWERHRFMLGEHNDLFRVMDVNGDVLLQSEDLSRRDSMAFESSLRSQDGAAAFADIRLNGSRYHSMVYPFTFNYHQPMVLQVAMSLAPVHRVLSRLLVGIMLGSGLILLSSFFVGSFLTGRILRPVAQVTRAANNISLSNLGVRIPEQEPDEELRLLVVSFNRMIGRLENSFEHVNEFSSHVAHELKTPLAIIKGELELALSNPELTERERQTFLVTLQESDRLIRIIKDLLLIAKFDYRPEIFHMERMDITVFLEDLRQRCVILASEKNSSYELILPEDIGCVRGDSTHLRRMILNLVHNAVKFSPDGSVIQVFAEATAGMIRIAVKDQGMGIQKEDQSKIFEKFFRGRAGSQGIPGTGLGLSMARAIARAHGGDIVFQSASGQGTTFVVSLPMFVDPSASSGSRRLGRTT